MVYALITASKMEREAATCSYARRILEPFPLTGKTTLTKQRILMEPKMPFICHWPGIVFIGTSSILFMKGKPSDP